MVVSRGAGGHVPQRGGSAAAGGPPGRFPAGERGRLRDSREWPLFLLTVLANALVLLAVAVGVDRTDNAVPFVELPGDAATSAVSLVLLAAVQQLAWREVRRAGVLARSVRVSEAQLPEVYRLLAELAGQLGLRTTPELYLTGVRGQPRTLTGRTRGIDFIQLHADLLGSRRDVTPDSFQANRAALAFVLGRELGRIRLGHNRFWYQLGLSFIEFLPVVSVLGTFLARAQERSCDRHGAAVSPQGARGLMLLTMGRVIYEAFDPAAAAERPGREGLWTRLARLVVAEPPLAPRFAALGAPPAAGPPPAPWEDAAPPGGDAGSPPPGTPGRSLERG
jgi:hypothetical protein